MIFFFYYPEYVSVSETLEFYRNEPGIASKLSKRNFNFALAKSTFGFFFYLELLYHPFCTRSRFNVVNSVVTSIKSKHWNNSETFLRSDSWILSSSNAIPNELLITTHAGKGRALCQKGCRAF